MLARAATGGGGLPPADGLGGTGSGGMGSLVQAGNVTVTAAGHGIIIATRASTFLHQQLRFAGRALLADTGATVQIQRRGPQTKWRWAVTTSSRVAASGSFSAVWNTNHIGQFTIRAVIHYGRSAHAAAASPAVTVTVYRPAIATFYGPGFYGTMTACGVRLGPATLGVANRTLRCGTRVALYYAGRTITVPVIDRGPYANHADFDLTTATASALGFPGLARIGAVSLPRGH
jgi:hypothetical protein